ncbi:MAG: hypothetical protein QGF16_02740 [Rhodospirillales bacterium]|nr:hypothetical protein [Rhodospirillales bacterium]
MQADVIDPHRRRNVLHLLLAAVLEDGFDPVADRFVDHARDADAAGFGQGFKPCRHIDPLAVDILAVIDDIAEIDAHPEFKAVGCQFLLHGDGAVDGVLDGRKLDQEAVAGELDDVAGITGDIWFYDFFTGILPGGDGAVGVGFHARRITGHVGGQDRRQPAFQRLIRHRPPRRTLAVTVILNEVENQAINQTVNGKWTENVIGTGHARCRISLQLFYFCSILYFCAPTS